MQASTSHERIDKSEHQAIARVGEQALRACRSSGAPRLVCVTVPLPPADPLALLEALALPGGARFYWEQPAQAFALAAGGAARRCRAAGPHRFHQVERQVRQALSAAFSARGSGAGSPIRGPLVLGGFSFFDQVDREHWGGFQPAELIVPEWAVVRQDDRLHGLVTLEVSPASTPHRVSGRVAAVAEGLQRAARAASAESFRPSWSRFPNRALDIVEPGAARWSESVLAARESIRRGLLDKVILARTMELRCDPAASPLAWVDTLRRAYPDCYAFLIDMGRGGSFLGATPERMARFTPEGIHLAAMAGTAPRGDDPEADRAQARYLMETPKERDEHRIVVEDILAAVAGLGEVECPPTPEVIRLTNLQHLHTPITLRTAGTMAPLSLLERLHPTAAVGGHPRSVALRLIRKYETFERGWYGAPIGWLDARGQGEFAVALRVGLLQGDRMRLFAGGGIMADSDPEREYQETRIKFQPLLSALGQG